MSQDVEEIFGVQGASMGDMLRALNSDDPQRAILEQRAALDELEDWVLTETKKWRHVAAIVEATNA